MATGSPSGCSAFSTSCFFLGRHLLGDGGRGGGQMRKHIAAVSSLRLPAMMMPCPVVAARDHHTCPGDSRAWSPASFCQQSSKLQLRALVACLTKTQCAPCTRCATSRLGLDRYKACGSCLHINILEHNFFTRQWQPATGPSVVAGWKAQQAEPDIERIEGTRQR